jgi:hypothetical protein
MPREYQLADRAGELKLLDVFQAELHYALPSDCHPEDWVIAPVPWQLLKRPCSGKLWDQMSRHAEGGATVLGGYGDRIAADDLKRRPMLASLALIEPEELWWWVREKDGERKNRALFRRNRVTFNLAVTDPQWLQQMNLLPAGIYPHAMLAPKAKHTWLTVSLSEAFEARAGIGAWHYRLVAGVIVR